MTEGVIEDKNGQRTASWRQSGTRRILVTGGTVFASRFIAEYYAAQGAQVYVLNRGRHPQPQGVTLIKVDRQELGDTLRSYDFDAVLDVTAYTGADVRALLDALGGFREYVLISSSAVYPETLPQPFSEEQPVGENKYWGAYGLGKIEAERELLKRVPHAYVLRPPYLYGPMNNVYREAFVFECAEAGRRFYLPRDGAMKLQFFHVADLCRCIDGVLSQHPAQQIFNVGNDDVISVRGWVEQCYAVVGKTPELVEVYSEENQRKYFSFSDYEYRLDVTRQRALIQTTVPLNEGLREAYTWYREHAQEVRRKDYIAYIDTALMKALGEA
ncbi:MAG: NAD-dependent epimerase/dehydratase family protein [Roseburia sp.]|nr:NAD-dependent epimerase/dehydratase family protein [Roseburia sp.]